MLELNKIYHWDCLELMKQLPDKSIDLVLTDPPYWIWIDKSMKMDANNKYWKSKAYKKDYWDTNRDEVIPNKEYFSEIIRVSKNQIIFWWNYFIEYLSNWPCWIVRDKDNWTNNFADCELAWTSFKSAVRKFKYKWHGMLQEDMINKEKRRHPTQKPIPLFKRILQNYSDQWQTILDPFLWSWTTAIACKELWRNFIGIEKEKKYIDIANKRLATTTQSLFIKS